MNKKSAVASLAMAMTLLITACSTTTTGYSREKKPADAARYNALLGLEYLRLGQLGKAKDKIERALKDDPRVPVTHTAAGMLYDRLGEPDKADKHFRDAIRLEPDDMELLNHYGVFLCRQNKVKQGEEMILRAARNPLYPTPYLAYTNAGLCMNGAGRAQDAEQYFGQALQLRPKFPRALAEMAQLKFSDNNNLEARSYVERYMKASNELPEPDPEMANVLWIGVRVEKALNNPAAAAVYAKRLKNDYPKAEQTRALLSSERSSE